MAPLADRRRKSAGLAGRRSDHARVRRDCHSMDSHRDPMAAPNYQQAYCDHGADGHRNRLHSVARSLATQLAESTDHFHLGSHSAIHG